MNRSPSPSSNPRSHIFVNPLVDTIIKHHASTSNKEIYGWLLGIEFSNGDSYIWAAIPCVKYTQQTEISALPDPIEFQDVSAVLPEGVGIIGIYHSHPSRIFHSTTDNATLARFSALYPKMISAVTNPFPVSENEENTTRWYSLDKDMESVHEISVVFQSFSSERLKFARWFASWEVHVKSTQTISSPNQLVPLLMPLSLDFLNGAEVSFLDNIDQNEPELTQNLFYHLLKKKTKNMENQGKERSNSKSTSNSKNKLDSINSKKWKQAIQRNRVAYFMLPPLSKTLMDDGDRIPRSERIWEYTVKITLHGSLFVDKVNFPKATEIKHRIETVFQSQLPEILSRSVFVPLQQDISHSFTILSENGVQLVFFEIPLNFGLYSQTQHEIFAPISSPDSNSSSLSKKWYSIIKRSEDEYNRIFQNQTARLENFRERLRLLGPDFFKDWIQPLESTVSQILANR